MKKASFNAVFATVIIFIFGCSESPTANGNYHKIGICYQSLDRSAEDVESEITMPVEEILISLQSIKSINSASSRNSAIITLEISQISNVEETIELIKNRLKYNRALLPLDIKEPNVTHVGDTSGSIKVCE